MVDLIETRIARLMGMSAHWRRIADGFLPASINGEIEAFARQIDGEIARMKIECAGKRICPCELGRACLGVDRDDSAPRRARLPEGLSRGCRGTHGYDEAATKRAPSLRASAGGGQALRRPNGRAIDGAVHRDHGPRDPPRSTEQRHCAAAKPPTLPPSDASLPARIYPPCGPCRSRRPLRLRFGVTAAVD